MRSVAISSAPCRPAAMNDQAIGLERVTPTACSRRLVLLAYVRAYQGKFAGISPSLGEMAAELRTSRSRIRAHLARLEREGMLLRIPGERRSILLLDDPVRLEAQALRLLRQFGWTVNDEIRSVGKAVTKSDLPG